MAMGLGRLRLSPVAFWAMTPRELAAALRVHGGEPRQRLNRSSLSELMVRFPDGQGS